jgi:cytochrome c-type biogenesis protein CcmF
VPVQVRAEVGRRPVTALGNFALLAGMVLAAWAGGAAVVGARRRSSNLVQSARYACYGVLALVALASGALVHAFLASDFRIRYIAHYSDRAMPAFYKATSFWGGMDGSLLFWLLILSGCAALAVHFNRERHRELIPWVIAVMSGIQLFFFTMLVFAANPFATFLTQSAVPADGRGLNPLLQNPYMVFHPPSLYTGYVGMSVPFAFGMAALITGNVDEAWIRSVRRFTIVAWFFLTLGLTLGMLWAYEELGWGGYWGWDPVENAGFLPWLTATAFLHSVMIQERRRMLRVWNATLVILTFLLTIFGTYMTRSGVIQSVHAFANSPVGRYFLWFIAGTMIVSFSVLIWRLPLLRSRDQLESPLSREFAFLCNNWILLLATLVILTLTWWPNISELLRGERLTVGPPFFNKWMVPIGLVLLLLTGVGPLIAWRKGSVGHLRHQFLWPGSLGIAIGLATGLLWAKSVPAGIAFGLCGFVFGTIFQEFWRGTRVRQRATGQDAFTALVGLVMRGRRRYGGYIIHLGIVLMFVGFAGDARKQDVEVTLKKGESLRVGHYTARYDDLKFTEDRAKEMITAHMTVLRDGREIARLEPARWYFHKHEDEPTTEVAIRRTPAEDLYLVLGGFELDSGVVNVKAIINPLVDWIWAGFGLLAMGAAIALAPEGLLVRVLVRVPAGAQTASLLLLAWLFAAPARAQMVDPSGAFSRPASSALEKEVDSELICMCGCARQTLADCRCGFAAREREAVAEKVRAGWTHDRIIAWYTKQRGPELGKPAFGWVALASPPGRFNQLSWVLPYATGGAGLFGLGALAFRIRKRRIQAAAVAPSPASEPTSTDPYVARLEDELSRVD